MATHPSLTHVVADFITGTSYDDIPPEALREARRCVTDGVGVMLAGSRSEAARIVRRYMEEVGARRGPSTIVGTAARAPAPFAALANGVAGHADDFDDTQLASRPDRVYGLLTHPTVPVLAATLAVAEEVGASGQEALAAFAIGQEVECKIAETINPDHYKRGFHSTGTIGIFGAAAAAARLLGLSHQQARFALGIAASKSAGIRVNFGTMTKPYHAGAAAENGAVAARLARLGYQSDPSALDGPWGFFQVAGGGCEPEMLVGKLGNPYSVVSPGVSVKPYPCGSLAHPSMDALLDLLTEHRVRPEQIAEIRLATTANVLNPLRYAEPRNELEAKFSLHFCLAILALERKAGIGQFTDQVVNRPDVREMMRKVRPYRDAAIEARGAELIRSRVELVLTDGRTLTRGAEVSRGTPQRPMAREELAAKVHDCARGTLPPEKVRQALDVIEVLEHQPDLSVLMRALVP